MTITFENNEYEDCKFLFKDISNEYLKNRAKTSLRYFINKANKFKRLYYLFAFLTISTPLAICVAMNIEGAPTYWSPLLVISCVLLTVLQTAFRFSERKNKNRYYAEVLKSELSKFHAEVGRYDKVSADERERILASRLNEIIKESNERI